MKTGVLLINLGTPTAPTVSAVRRYLREFLLDKRVVDLPVWLRYLLVYGIILPFRSPKSTKAYQMIWQKTGSPLLYHSEQLRAAVAERLGEKYCVALAMRYAQPNMQQAVLALQEAGCDTIIVLPLFPQYSSAATGSALEKWHELQKSLNNISNSHVISDFFEEPLFIQAWANVIREQALSFQPQHWLLSYHGLPMRQVLKSESASVNCDRTHACPSVNEANRFCYRAQSYATSRALAMEMGWHEEQYSVAFQSRIGKVPWILPYTDVLLQEWRKQGIDQVAVICPSFVADCLETLEEIGIRAQKQWQAMGGKDFALIPALNNHPAWVQALVTWIRRYE